MTVIRLCRLLFAFSLLGATPVLAQPSDEAAVSTNVAETIKGGWAVAYEDQHLGLVKGRAYLDTEFNSAEITLTHPNTGQKIKLKARSFTISGTEIELVLPPGSPSANGPFTHMGDMVSTDRSTTKLNLGDTEQIISLGIPPAPDGSVKLTLTYDRETDSLSGFWHQQVDAVSGQASQESGRTGYYRFGSQTVGGADMIGREVWRRPPPIIKGTFAIKDQFGATLAGPNFAYPYPGGRTTPANTTHALRHVMVIGKFLPQRFGEGTEIKSLDDKIEYSVYRFESSYQPPPLDTYYRDKGFERVLEMQKTENPPFKWEKNDDDFLILRVNLKPGVLPGRKKLTINGTPTEWLLRFGDHKAEIGFARDNTQDLRDRQDIDLRGLAIETEMANFVYQSEQVYLEVRTAVPLPMDSVPVMIAKNGKFLKFNGKRELTAIKSSNPDEPAIYRTPPLYLIDQGQQWIYPPTALTIVVNQKDQLQAQLGGDPVLNVSPTFGQVSVLTSPTDIRGAILGDWTQLGISWPEAVYRAAKCANVDDLDRITDVNALTREEADYFSDAVITTLFSNAPSILTTRIKVGEHAGMIMLRQMIVDLMKQSLPLYEKPLTDKQILALRARLRNAVKYSDIALEKMKVVGPDGRLGSFDISFYPTLLEQLYDLKGEKRTAYQISSMREARQKLVVAMKASIQRAESVTECDVHAMTYLTGFSMQGVQLRANDALMKLKEVTDTFPGVDNQPVTMMRRVWVPDRQARARVSNVALVAETLRAQEGLSNSEWNSYFLTVALLSFPLNFTSIEVLLAAVLIIDVTDFGVNLYQEGTQQYGEEVELKFAKGAAALIGTRRYNRAAERDKPWFVSAFKILMSTAQVVGSSADFVTSGLAARSVERGQELAAALRTRTGEGNEAIRRLPQSQRQDLMSAVVHARRLEENIGRAAMETQELAALRFSDLVESGEFAASASRAATKPWWAQSLDDAAFRRLDDMIGRDDIIRLVKDNTAEMGRLLTDDDAITILRLPQKDINSFKKAVQKYKDRAPTRGPEFVRQAHPSTGNPEGLHFGDIGLSARGGMQTADMRVYHGIDNDGPMVGYFTRGRVADDVFNTGKDFFVFDTAQTFRQMQLAGKPPGPVTHAPGPRWINDVRVPLRDNAPGVPFVMFSNMRTYQALGFNFADPNLAGIMLKNVQSANTAGQLHWLRHAYPEKSVSELFRYTQSYRYAQNTAEQLGFKISNVEVRGVVPSDGGGIVITEQLKRLVDGPWFEPGRARTAAEAAAARQDFIKTYRVADAPDIPISFDVYLKFQRIN